MSPSRTFKSSGADKLSSRVKRFALALETEEAVGVGIMVGVGLGVEFCAWAVQLVRSKLTVNINSRFIENEGNHFE